MGDYVGDATQYPKWHVYGFRGLLFISAAMGQTAGPILMSMSQNACFWKY